ncbi:MAG: sugar phosphate isomerase/epimerase [Planctomycetes bacterium]|nr:sugar phosphate isomerase/epimerase [Planctomycetota bacterium]
MKISLQEGLLPGRTLEEKLDFAESLGVEGVEVSGRSRPYEREDLPKALRGRQVRLSSLCGQSTFDFLDPDPKKRRESIEESKRNLAFCGEFGAAGQIVPPIFGPARVPDLSPVMDPLTIEKKLLVEITKELAAYAAEHRTLLLLEPLNRYEQHFLRRQADGIEIIEMAGRPKGVALLSDFFHMHIEETSTPAALRSAGKWVGHVHMADNTRLEPGSGDIDWHAGLGALKSIGFTGYLAWECGISGDRAVSLKRSVEFIRGVLASL